MRREYKIKGTTSTVVLEMTKGRDGKTYCFVREVANDGSRLKSAKKRISKTRYYELKSELEKKSI